MQSLTRKAPPHTRRKKKKAWIPVHPKHRLRAQQVRLVRNRDQPRHVAHRQYHRRHVSPDFATDVLTDCCSIDDNTQYRHQQASNANHPKAAQTTCGDILREPMITRQHSLPSLRTQARRAQRYEDGRIILSPLRDDWHAASSKTSLPFLLPRDGHVSSSDSVSPNPSSANLRPNPRMLF